MRVALLAHGLRVAGGASVGRNLIAMLAEVAPHHEYLITIPSGVGYEGVCEALPNCETVVFDNRRGLLPRLRFERYHLPELIRAFRPDVLAGLGNIGLTRPPCPQVIFIQESHLVYPRKHFGPASLGVRLLVSYHRWLLTRQLKRTDLVICQTRVMEVRLRRTFNFVGPMVICPNSVSLEAIPQADEDVMPNALVALSGKTKLFYLAKYYPHKGFEQIVETFHRHRKELAGVVLIMTIDRSDPRAARLLASIDTLGLSDRIVNVGPLPQAQLARYYQHCDALLMPTILESFSGTYLEAMHFGLPILTSDLDFARGICGDAALFFDPWDPMAIRDAILTLKVDPLLAENLARRGKKQLSSACQPWNVVAADFVHALELVAGQGFGTSRSEPLVHRLASEPPAA